LLLSLSLLRIHLRQNPLRNLILLITSEKLKKTLSSLELKRIHKPKFPPTSLTKNWYPRPTPPDIQFEEINFQSQFAVFANKLYEWNIDGLSEHQILDKLTHMTMVSNSYATNHSLGQPKVIDLLVSGFT
jgi:hypothetical protein